MIPTINVKINASKFSKVKRLALAISFTSIKIAPTLTGINNEKEKLKAFTDDSPSINPEKIVPPDLETAGKIANAWKQPITKADKYVILISLVFINFVEKTIDAVIKNKKGRSSGLLVIVSILSFNKKPTITAGIDPTIIWGRYLKKNEILFLKNTRTDKKVAAWKKISKVNDGVNPNKYWTKFKWPSEEIGKNSDTPWTKPRKNNWKIFMYLILLY